MLPISDLTITLRPSKDYARLSLLLFVLAAYLVIEAAWPLVLRILGLLGLLLNVIWMMFLPKERQLTYHGSYWFLQTKDLKKLQFESVTIDFDGGLFLLLVCQEKERIQRMIVFKDQLTKEAIRHLRWIARCKKKG